MYIPLTFEGSQAKCLYASGGYEGYFISGSDEYKYHAFFNDGNFEILAGTLNNITILLVAGGGGGGYHNSLPGQGGGGGGVELFQNQRLFGGNYGVKVGGGGIGAVSGPDAIGNTGGTSSFSGSLLFVTASGGQGGSWFGYVGGTLGRSGNNKAGGLNVSAHGGGGGGATGIGQNGNATAPSTGDGGAGYSLFEGFGNGITDGINYGCGGGGAASATSITPGNSCIGGYGDGNNQNGNNTSINGAVNQGTGGGGGKAGPTGAGDGSSGLVYIQYKINSYCKNFFNKTGPCGCKQLEFSNSYYVNFQGGYTSSYVYTPCGTNLFVSSSIIGYGSRTLCAEPGTYYNGPLQSSTGNEDDTTYISGFVSGGADCSTGSVCGAIPQFTSSCSSSYYTYYNQNTGLSRSVWYVGRNSTEITASSFGKNVSANSGSRFAGYVCQSTLSTNNISGSNPELLGWSGSQTLVLNFYRLIELVGSATVSSTINWWDQTGTFQQTTKLFTTSSQTWDYTFTASFASGSPYFTGVRGALAPLDFVMLGNPFTGSLPTCGCP